MLSRTAVDGGNHGGAVTLLVGHRDRSRGLHAPRSDIKFDCKMSVSFSVSPSLLTPRSCDDQFYHVSCTSMPCDV
jgi:hypothetical protein